MKKVSIIILDYKNKEDTIACVASIDSLEKNDSEISLIVVNNDTTAVYQKDMFLSKFPLEVINNTVNSGYAGGNNTGIAYALSQEVDYILLLNNDTIVAPSLLTELLSVYDQKERVGLISPKIYFAKGHEYHKDRYDKNTLGKIFWYAGGVMDWKNILGKHRGVDEVDTGQYDVLESTDFATGCCMLLSTKLIKKIGLFDERYFLYYEDSDLNERVKKNGYTIFYAPKAILWHKNAGSTGGSGSQLQDYYITRNRMLFGMTYAPLRSKIALLKESLKIVLRGRSWQKIGIKDYYLHTFGKGSFVIR